VCFEHGLLICVEAVNDGCLLIAWQTVVQTEPFAIVVEIVMDRDDGTRA
jgi:hypothetical protein